MEVQRTGVSAMDSVDRNLKLVFNDMCFAWMLGEFISFKSLECLKPTKREQVILLYKNSIAAYMDFK